MPTPAVTTIQRGHYKVEYADPAGRYAGWFIFSFAHNSGSNPADADVKAAVLQELKNKGFDGCGVITISSVYFTDEADFSVWSA